VRMGVLKFSESAPLENVVEEDFPLPRTQYNKAFLEANGKLSLDKTPQSAQKVSYDSENGEHIAFTHTISEKTQIIGMPKAVLYMSCEDLDAMDVYLLLRKISASGKEMLNLNIPWKGLPVSKIADIPNDLRTEVVLYAGPTGIQRASMRAIDESKSMHENRPYYPMDKVEKVPRGEIVRLEIGTWATGIQFEAGESIRFHMCGRHQGINNFGTTEFANNKGNHVTHFGGEYDSHVALPFT
jgi:predicted acyl esterase